LNAVGRSQGHSAASVIRLGWPVANAWLLRETPIGPLLVDSGFPPLWPLLRRALRRCAVAPHALAAVVLTHRHCDHAGNAALLQQRYGVPVYAHRRDAEVLAGRRPRPQIERLGGVAGGMGLFENRFPAAACEPIPLEDGARVGGLTVLWMPGHTAGSVFLHQPETGLLFTGDALLNAEPPLTYRSGLSLPYAGYCEDHALALASLVGFLRREIEPRLLCAGHGPARPGPIRPQVERLLARAGVLARA